MGSQCSASKTDQCQCTESNEVFVQQSFPLPCEPFLTDFPSPCLDNVSGGSVETAAKPHYREWTVVLSKRSGQCLGMEIDYCDGVTLKIVSIKTAGLIAAYNSTAYRRICAGDRIISANGMYGDSNRILQESKPFGDLKLRILREQEWVISFSKLSASEPIGDVDATCMTINAVGDGAFANFNKSLSEDDKKFEVKPGARIIEVNGLTEPTRMMNELQHKCLLNIVLVHSGA